MERFVSLELHCTDEAQQAETGILCLQLLNNSNVLIVSIFCTSLTCVKVGENMVTRVYAYPSLCFFGQELQRKEVALIWCKMIRNCW